MPSKSSAKLSSKTLVSLLLVIVIVASSLPTTGGTIASSTCVSRSRASKLDAWDASTRALRGDRRGERQGERRGERQGDDGGLSIGIGWLRVPRGRGTPFWRFLDVPTTSWTRLFGGILAIARVG